MRKLFLNTLKLACWIVGLWFFFAVLTPRLLTLSTAWQKYDAVQEEYNLVSGALYYSDVPVTQAAEEHVRQAVQEGMFLRKLRLQKKD